MNARLLTASQVAEILGIARLRVYRYVATGELQAVRIGRSLRVPSEALEVWLRAKATASRPAIAETSACGDPSPDEC